MWICVHIYNMFRKDEAAKQQNDIISIQYVMWNFIVNILLWHLQMFKAFTTNNTCFQSYCKATASSWSVFMADMSFTMAKIFYFTFTFWQTSVQLPRYDNLLDSSLATSMFLCWYPVSVSVKCTHILVVITAMSLKILWLLHLKLHDSVEFQCRILKYTVIGEYKFSKKCVRFLFRTPNDSINISRSHKRSTTF